MTTDYEPRCWRCKRVLAGFMSRPWEKRCERCKADNASEPVDNAQKTGTLRES